MKTAPSIDQTITGADSDIGHYYCPECRPDADIAFCGTDITGDDFLANEEDVDCVVCTDLEYCPICDQENDQ